MLATLRQRNFALLWFAGLISMAGDWGLRIALPIYVYQYTNSTLATGIMFMIQTLPTLLLSSVAGVFVDRWERKRTMVISNLLMALSLMPLLLVQSAEQIWIIYVVAFAEALIGQFFGPAENAFLPQLVEKGDLVAANALNALNNNIARLSGPMVGAFVITLGGLAGVALFDAATYLLAAGLIAAISVTSNPAAAKDSAPETSPLAAVQSVGREWVEGLRIIRASRVVSLLCLFTAITSVGEGIITTLFIPFVTEVLKAQPIQLGWLLSAQAIGGILGGLIVGWIGSKLGPTRLLGISGVLFGLTDLAIFNYPAFFPGIGLALILFIVVGFPASGFSTSMTVLLQQGVADQYRGRVFGVQIMIMAMLSLVGMAIAGTLGDVLGIVPVINVQGYVYIIVGLLALTLFGNQPTPAPTTTYTEAVPETP